jgi:hypothetical protein
MDALEYWERLLNESNVFIDIFRLLGWLLVKGLKVVSDLVETLVDEVYNLLDFTSYAGIDQFFDSSALKILLTVLLTFAIAVLGWTLIFNAQEAKPKILQQLSIIVIVVCAMPMIFTFLNDLTLDVRGVAQGDVENLSDQIISEGIVDLQHIDGVGFDNYTVTDNIVTGKNGEQKNGFLGGKEENASRIDINEKITDELDITSEDILLQRIGTTESGDLVVEEIQTESFLGIDMTNWYYRYYVDYLSIFLCLIATIVAYFFTAWKVAKILFELAFHHLLAVFMSASDLTSGQRIKTVFKSLGSIYVVLMLLPFLLRLYALGQTYVGQNVSNGFVKGFILIAMAFAVIDGPNVIERVLGVDAGIKSGFQTLATTFMAARAGTAVAKGAGKLAGAGLGTLAGAGKGMASGMAEGFRNQRDSAMSDAAKDSTSEGGIHDQQINSQAHQNENQQVNEQQNNHMQKNSQGDQETANGKMAPDGSAAGTEGGIAAQVSATQMQNNPGEKPDGIGSSAGNPDQGKEASQGISDGVKKNVSKKGMESPVGHRNKFQTNPNSVIGTTGRSYNNAKIVGGGIGKGVGTLAGKIGNRVSPPKPQPPKKEKSDKQ